MKETLEQTVIDDQEEMKIERQPSEESLNKKAETEQGESPDQMLLKTAFDKLYDFEPTTEEEKWSKSGIQESLEDIGLLLEDDEDDPDSQTPSSKMIALRGMDEIQKNYPLTVDVGLDELRNHLAADIESSEGFGIDEIEDLDSILEQNQGDLEAGINELIDKSELTAQELDLQKEKLQNYAEVKKGIDEKRAQLMKNGTSFYGGYAQKIKTTFEGAGEKIDAKMMNSKLLKMIGEKKLTTRFSKVAAAGVLIGVGGMMMFNPAESEAAEMETGEMQDKPEAGADSHEEAETEVENQEADQELLDKLNESQEKVVEFISDLGIFSQIKLINDIKENADAIKDLVNEGNEQVTESASKNLNKVLDIYSGPLNEAKEKNPELYQQEVQKVCEMIDTIKTSSLRELKSKFA